MAVSSVYILLVYFATKGLSLTCYECENCQENEPYLRNHMRQCPDSTYISCLMTESKFAHHKMTSRSCSKAPAVNPDCSNHLVNIMRATVCICDQPLCNGLNAVANFSTLNSRIFSNTNINNLVTNNNQNNNKENFMPLHDFNEQRIAAMSMLNGVSKQVMMSSMWTSLSTIFLFTLIIALK